MEGVYYTMDEYKLKPGHYVICDPAYIIRKNKTGDQFNKKVITAFFKDMNKFHHLVIDGIECYMFRSLGGDGIFNGLGTDTGTFIIIETKQLNNDERFRQDYSNGHIITFETNEFITANVQNFNLFLSNGITVHTE